MVLFFFVCFKNLEICTLDTKNESFIYNNINFNYKYPIHIWNVLKFYCLVIFIMLKFVFIRR